jgi:hypothetical protein
VAHHSVSIIEDARDVEPTYAAYMSGPPVYLFTLFTDRSDTGGPAMDTFELESECDGKPVDVPADHVIDPAFNYLVVRTHPGRATVSFPDSDSSDGIKILPNCPLDVIFCDKDHFFASHRASIWDVVVRRGSVNVVRK